MTTQAAPRLKSVGATITGAATTTVYTCPNNFTSKVTLVFISNRTNGNVSVKLEWDDASNGDAHNILSAYTIGGFQFLQLSDAYLVLNSSDSLKVTTQSGANIDVIVSCEEFFDPAQSTTGTV
jgi:hypothetical protein